MNFRMITIALLGLCFNSLKAQQDYSFKTTSFDIPLLQSGQFGENISDIFQFGQGEIAPAPGGDYRDAKTKVNQLRRAYEQRLNKSDAYKSIPSDLNPEVDTTFNGQFGGTSGIPCDNHIAISNAGKIISVQNSTIRVLDESGKTLLFKSLFAFANGKVAGLTNYCYDPKVVYDPLSDRFIVFFLHESKVVSNFGIMAFSKTEDPLGAWNFYKIPGNALKNDKWSDYPILAISKEDVFLTLNLLTENTDWRVGFNQSLIWQINKNSGYNGDSLQQKVYYDIRYKSKAIWSICPVQGGYLPTHPNMYFLSVRPGDLSNDTLFLHEVNQTLSSGKATLNYKILTADKPYGLPPVAPQPIGGDTLQTNDCRVLGGIIHNGKIQYVQTSVIKPYYRSGIFHGMFDVKLSERVNAHYISTDSIDYAYPSIAYAGRGANSDQASVITFSHVSGKSYPGFSAVFHNQVSVLPSIFSEVVRVKEGVKAIERLPFAQYPHERWGDYSGVQYKYNEPGTLWLVGTYGNENKVNGTWIGKLKVVNTTSIETDMELRVFPNPLQSSVAVGLLLEISEKVSVQLYDVNGQWVKNIFEGDLSTGYNELYFNADRLSHGTYFIRVRGEKSSLNLKAKLIR